MEIQTQTNELKTWFLKEMKQINFIVTFLIAEKNYSKLSVTGWKNYSLQIL